jgi:DnaK suppressor protein
MDTGRARELVARERRRIEAALAELTGEERDEDESRQDQSGESDEAGADLQTQMVDEAVATGLRTELESVGRAEARIADGTYGRSIDSGARIPDARLEAQPLAERTVEEQELFERSRG